MDRDVVLEPPGEQPMPPRGRNIVAVIGIDRYSAWPRLDNAVNDAKGALELFRKLGFEPLATSLFDEAASGDAIRKLVTDDLRVALGPADSLVLFFAGHGHTRRVELADGQVVKTGYIIGANGDMPGGDIDQWIRLDTWLSEVARLPAHHILVILDACRSGVALDALIKHRDVNELDDGSLDQLRARRSRRVITSALDDQRALDSGPVPGHSLFTGHLIEGLTRGLGREGRRFTTGSELGLYLQRRVSSYPSSEQTPDFGALELDNRGELVLGTLSGRTRLEDAEVRAGRSGQATRPRVDPAWRWLGARWARALLVAGLGGAAVLALPRLLIARATDPIDDAAHIEWIDARDATGDGAGGAATIVGPPGVTLEPITFEPGAASEQMLVQAVGGPQVAVRDVKQQGTLPLAIRPSTPGGFSIAFAEQGTVTCDRGATHIARFSVEPPGVRAARLAVSVDGARSTWEGGRDPTGDIRACLDRSFAASSSVTFSFGDAEKVTCDVRGWDRMIFVPVDPPLDRLEVTIGGITSSWSSERKQGRARACAPATGDVELAQLPEGQHVTIPAGLGTTSVGVRRPRQRSTDPAATAWAPCKDGETARGIALVGVRAADAEAFGFAPIAGALAVTCSPPRTTSERGRVCSLGDSVLRCQDEHTGPCRLQTDGDVSAGGENESCAAATPAETKRARDTGLRSSPRLHCTEVYRCR